MKFLFFLMFLSLWSSPSFSERIFFLSLPKLQYCFSSPQAQKAYLEQQEKNHPINIPYHTIESCNQLTGGNCTLEDVRGYTIDQKGNLVDVWWINWEECQ